MESRTQGSRPRPRTQKKSEAKAKDSLSEDRHSRGQGHKRKKCSPKKKRYSQKFFRRSPQNNVFQKIFQAIHKILTIQKILLSSSRGKANFRGLEASRTSSGPRMFSRTPPLVISKAINFAAHLSKWTSKNKGPTRARAKSQLN